MVSQNTIEVKQSAIEGRGLFACRIFGPDETIHRINVVREITPEAPLRPDLGERYDHCDYPDGKVMLIGYPSHHLNHSCDPNAFTRYESDTCFVVARRRIHAGEEITVDYNINISGGTAWPCRCGSSRCLGTVMGDFFLLPADRQTEYRPFLADWFVRRHADRLTGEIVAET